MWEWRGYRRIVRDASVVVEVPVVILLVLPLLPLVPVQGKNMLAAVGGVRNVLFIDSVDRCSFVRWRLRENRSSSEQPRRFSARAQRGGNAG